MLLFSNPSYSRANGVRQRDSPQACVHFINLRCVKLLYVLKSKQCLSCSEKYSRANMCENWRSPWYSRCFTSFLRMYLKESSSQQPVQFSLFLCRLSRQTTLLCFGAPSREPAPNTWSTHTLISIKSIPLVWITKAGALSHSISFFHIQVPTFQLLGELKLVLTLFARPLVLSCTVIVIPSLNPLPRLLSLHYSSHALRSLGVRLRSPELLLRVFLALSCVWRYFSTMPLCFLLSLSLHHILSQYSSTFGRFDAPICCMISLNHVRDWPIWLDEPPLL